MHSGQADNAGRIIADLSVSDNPGGPIGAEALLHVLPAVDGNIGPGHKGGLFRG